jgi:anaerobic ribonucleoside-triphosphate reductase activating protein
MPDLFLRLHHFEPRSRSNGPGLRSVLWLQGCTLGCPGCFNPQTHAISGGQLLPVAEISRRITEEIDAIEGVTISGGEPLQQAEALVRLLREIRQRTRLSVVLFTGYSWEEAMAQPQAVALLPMIDVLLAGRYRSDLRVASSLLGSSNKTAHFLSQRYTQADLDRVPPAEILIAPDGEMRFSGIEPLRW